MLWRPETTALGTQATTTEARVPKSPCSAAREATTMRSPNCSSPGSPQLENSARQWRPSKINKRNYRKKKKTTHTPTKRKNNMVSDNTHTYICGKIQRKARIDKNSRQVYHGGWGGRSFQETLRAPFLFFNLVLLEGNCFTTLCRFLPYVNTSQP